MFEINLKIFFLIVGLNTMYNIFITRICLIFTNNFTN
jgi:hypothetical protein